MQVAGIVFVLFVVAFTAAAAVLDWKTKRLPNALTVPAFVCALLFHPIVGATQAGLVGAGHRLAFALGGFATGFGILFVLWLIGGGGGGDVKLMGALGAWLGAFTTLQVFFVSVVFVAIGTLGVLAAGFCRVGFERTKRRYFSQSDKKSTSARGRRGVDPAQMEQERQGEEEIDAIWSSRCLVDVGRARLLSL